MSDAALFLSGIGLTILASLSVVMLGIVLSRFIPKARPQMEIKQGTKAAA